MLSNVDSSDAASSKDLQYCGSNVTWEFEPTTGVLTIKGSKEVTMMSDFTSGSTPWDENKDSVKSVVIESSVTTIGDNAFSSCPNLTYISIPKSITYIGASAFNGTFYASDGKTELEPTAENLKGSSFTKTDDKWIQQVPSTPQEAIKEASSDIFLIMTIIAVIFVLVFVDFVKKKTARFQFWGV